MQPVTLPVAYLTQVGDHPSLAARRSGAPRHRGSIGRVRATLLQQPLQEPPRPRALRRAALHRSLAHAQACRGARRRRYSICRPDGRGLARESGVEPTPNVWVLNRIKAVKTRRKNIVNTSIWCMLAVKYGEGKPQSCYCTLECRLPHVSGARCVRRACVSTVEYAHNNCTRPTVTRR